MGSGTIIDKDGTILTCAHVVTDFHGPRAASKGKASWYIDLFVCFPECNKNINGDAIFFMWCLEAWMNLLLLLLCANSQFLIFRLMFSHGQDYVLSVYVYALFVVCVWHYFPVVNVFLALQTINKLQISLCRPFQVSYLVHLSFHFHLWTVECFWDAKTY